MANLLSTSITGTAITSGSVVIGGNFTNNPYNNVSSTRLLFGGGNEPNNYFIGTNLENYGGNYTKLDLRWHTGIRMGAQPSYGGIRFFNNETLGSRIMSIGESDANVRIDNNLWIGGAGGWITDLFNAKYSTSGGAINGYVRINQNWAGGDYSAEALTIRGTYPSITLRSTTHNNVWLIHNDDNISFYYGGGVDGNDWSRRFFIPTDGNIWMSWAGDYISNLLAAKQNTSTAITTSNIGSQSVSYANSAGNSSQLEGFSAYALVTEARGAHSGSDFVNGTLVTTDINANGWAGDSFIMEVSGKSYGSGTPFKLIMEGYLYADTIINVSAMSYGYYFPAPVKVMRYNGNVAFWWPRGSYWNSFEVHVRSANGDSWNRVTGITDSVDPASADKKISITPTQVIHTGNIASQSVSYADESGFASSAGAVEWTSVQNKPATFPPSSHNHDYLSNNSDSEQEVGLRYASWNAGAARMNTDPRWNESGYDADLGCLHIWAWTAGGSPYGRAGIALYNGSAYQYLTTRSGATGMFVNNQEIIHSGNIGSQSVSVARQLLSPNDATVVAADSAMPSAGHSFIHTLALGPSGNDGHILGMTWAGTTSVYGAQIFLDTDPNDIMAIRSRSSTGVWTSWKTIIHSGNIASQSVSYADESGYSSSTGTTDNIGGVQFRNTGSNAGTNADTIDSNGITYYTAGVANFSGNATDGALYSQRYSTSWQHQIAGDYRSGQIALRGRNNGTWQAWRTVLDSSNFTSWAQEKENQRLSTGNGPTFANVYTAGWFRNYGNQGIYNETYGTHFYSNQTNAWSITGSGGNIELQFRSNHQSTLRGWVYANTSNEIGFLSEDGNWVLKTWNRGVEAYGSMRAPIFYDSNDTTFFLDPNADLSLRVYGEICNSNYAEGKMQPGALNIGRIDTNYAWDGGSWASDVRLGLLANTSETWEFGIHDSGDSVMSVVHFDGGSTLTMGRNLGWGQCVVNAPAGYVSNGNPWGTSNSAFFPNGITTAGSANWIYGTTTYIGNAPSNGSGHDFSSSGHQLSTGSITVPLFLVNNHSDNTRGYRIHNTSGSSVSAMFTNSANALVIGAGAFDQVQLNKKVLVSGAALGVNVAASATAGRIDASNDIVAYSSSDERLKENIAPIENALDKVKSLTGVEFDWKPEYKHAHGYEGHDTGIIAQQVEAVMPSAVRTNDTGFLAVRYEKLIGLLIEANKELAARVEELEKKIK